MWQSSVPSFDSDERERGGALLVALALLALAAALLAASAQAGRAIARSAQLYGASISVEAESRSALAEFVSAWSTAYDSLKIGASAEAVTGPRRVGAGGLVAVTRFRLMRVSGERFVVGLESSVGPPGLSMARRRLSLIIERRPMTDTSVMRRPPGPIARWSLSDLF
jgi:hypothetical protein